jgi:hypothetical protein
MWKVWLVQLMQLIQYWIKIGFRIGICLTCIPKLALADNLSISYKIDEPTACELLPLANSQASRCEDYDYQGDFDSAAYPFYPYEWLGLHGDPLGWFAVNPWTGDVWDIWNCKHITSNALKKKQDRIRQRFTADEIKQYDQLAAIKPTCIN